MSRHKTYDWGSSPPDVADILWRHSMKMTGDIDVQILMPHFKQSTMFTYEQHHTLQDTGQFALTNREKAKRLLQFIVPHSVRGLKALVNALLTSGKSAPHLGHTYWGQQLAIELTVSPEDRENLKQQKQRRENMCDRFFILVKENLYEQSETNNGLVKCLKAHLLLLPEERNDVCYTEMKQTLRKFENTNDIIETLASYNLFCHRCPLKLIEIARIFCTVDIHHHATEVEMLFS